MRDPRLDSLARTVVGYCAAVRPGDLVTIVGEPACLPAVEALFEHAIRTGAHPSFHAKSERLHEILLREGDDDQLRHVSPFEAHRLELADVLIVLLHPLNTRCNGRIDPRRVAANAAARKDLLAAALQRAASNKQRYTLTEIPGHAAAQDAGMSLADYEDLVYRAGMLDRPDPVAAWRALGARQEIAARWLETRSVLRFRAPPSDGHGGRMGGGRQHDGTDLSVQVSGQRWVSCAGAENFPDGEVFSGPTADGVDGVVNFDFPSLYRGREVAGIRLRFKAGRVADASATVGEDHLHAMLGMDDGAGAVGEIALGTNYALPDGTRNAFFDEKIGGTFHLALGAGYPQTGNSNTSGLHWDLVCDLRRGGSVEADGEVIQRDGRFLPEGWPA